MKAKQGRRIGQIFADGRQVDEALRLAARDAIRKHALTQARTLTGLTVVDLLDGGFGIH